MTFAEFQKSVDDHVVPPVLLFHGEEPFLARLGVALLRSRVLAPGSEAFDFVSLTGRETTAEAIVAQATTVPMISARRLTIVYDFEQMNPSQRGGLLEYVRSPVESACLVLVSFVRLGGKNKFEREVLSAAVVVECSRPSSSLLEALVTKMAGERGVQLDNDALAILIDWTDGELNRVANELDKLACFARDGGRVTVVDVEAVVGAKASGIRELAAAIAEKNTAQALAFFHELTEAGIDEAQLVSQLYGLWVALWQERAHGRRARGGGGVAHLPAGVSDIRRLAAARTSREYARGVEAFYRADTAIRQGLSARSTVGILIYELSRSV